MIIGIDASNIRGGGGVTHLVEMLRAAVPAEHGISEIVVWAGRSTLERIEARPWIRKEYRAALDGSLLKRVAWQRFRLSDEARSFGCHVLFVPGGTYSGTFRPMVTMSQNLLPFEARELDRYGLSWMNLKMRLLRRTQARTFLQADCVVFLTDYAERVVREIVRVPNKRVATIAHGVDERFSMKPREQRPINAYCASEPFRIVYVSVIDEYKHQRHVATAVTSLRAMGFPVALDLIGPSHTGALSRLRSQMSASDPEGQYLRYRGSLRYEDVRSAYAGADLSVFASSCESFGQILTESMSAGLPIACSNRSAMPEVLGEAGIYFDPENPREIADALRRYIESPALRAEKARIAYERAKLFTWRECASRTLSLLSRFASGAAP